MLTSRKFSTAAAGAAFFLVLVHPLWGQNLTSERDNFHNTAYIKADDETVKTALFLCGEALQQANYSAAVSQLLRVLKVETDALVPFGERTFLGTRETVIRRILSMPDRAVDLYLERAEAEAAALIASTAGHDRAERLQEATDRYPLTPSARKAALLLGDLAFERGSYLQAAHRYKGVMEEGDLMAPLQRSADPGLMSEARLRLYLSLCLAGRAEEAASFRPEGTFTAAGKAHGPEDLDRLLQGLPEVPETSGRGGWPTRGGGMSRLSIPDFDCSGLDFKWHYALNGGAADREEEVFDPVTLRYLKARKPESTVYPIVYDGVVYAFDSSALYPLDLEEGRLRYGPYRWDWSLLFGDEAPELENVTYSGTVASGVLYATLNRRISDFERPMEHKGILVALDLEREAFPLWRWCGEETEEETFKGVAFTGAPAVAGDQVFVMGTRYAGSGEARAEARLYCFHAATGKLLFERFLCSGAEVDRFEIRLGAERQRMRDRVELGSPVAEHLGDLYCLTNLGVVGAVDAFSGSIRWLFKYNRLFSRDPDRYYRDYYLDTGGWRDSLPVIQDRRLYVAPRDSRFFYGLALAPDREGFIILDDPLEKARRVSFIGISGERLYFTAREGGRNFVIAMERDGPVAWESVPFETEDRIAGSPLLTKYAVFVPTLRYIYRMDLNKRGLVTHMFTLPPRLRVSGRGPARFGNIVAVGDHLISVSSEDVIVFKAASKK